MPTRPAIWGKEKPLGRHFFRLVSGRLPALVFLAICGLCLGPKTAWTAEGTEHKPLFPVRVTHPVPHARETFEEVKSLILKHYYTDAIDEETLYWAAIEGMLRRISPPQNPDLAKIWTADEYDKQLMALTGQGVTLGIKSSFNAGDGSLTVNEVVDGSPAAEHLQPLDRILRIDGQALQGKPVGRIQQMLAGEEGQSIDLTVARDVNIFEVTLAFAKMETDNLHADVVTPGVALVRIKSFTAGLSKKLSTRLEELRKQEVTGIILDLRNNPGGVFIEALRVAELFLGKKKILLRTLQRETPVQNYVSDNNLPFDFRLTVLVNPKTASSAEILAGCLQDHQRGLIIGARTYGKGIFEKTFKLENDMRVKFITGAMYSPKGVSWHGRGLTPDFLVEQDEKTLKSLYRLQAQERFSKDVGAITAFKLLKCAGI